MQKIACLILILICWSCSLDDGSDDNIQLEIVPITTVDMPESLLGGDINRISFSYIVPSTCHSFDNLYYLANRNERTLAVVTNVVNDLGSGNPCEDLIDVEESGFLDFYAAPGFDSYTFNFWQGTDENGEDIYLRATVPVNN
ncbi:MAG: hypothetical protein KC469_02890 [Flavobacteriaceae bacterium]|nr:hypothetical protein [Flavobacteriaceae bacterium]